MSEWAQIKWKDTNRTVMETLQPLYLLGFKIYYINGNAKKLHGGVLLGEILNNTNMVDTKAVFYSEVKSLSFHILPYPSNVVIVWLVQE